MQKILLFNFLICNGIAFKTEKSLYRQVSEAVIVTAFKNKKLSSINHQSANRAIQLLLLVTNLDTASKNSLLFNMVLTKFNKII